MWRFRDELLAGRTSDHVDLALSDAGMGGGSSFISDSAGRNGSGRSRSTGGLVLRMYPSLLIASRGAVSWSTPAV